SAWASEYHLSLGQVAVDSKSNEITAIPQLLELMDVQEALTKPPLEPKEGASLEQVDSILTALPERKRVKVAVLAFTGIRSGELQRLKPEDLDLVGNWLHI